MSVEHGRRGRAPGIPAVIRKFLCLFLLTVCAGRMTGETEVLAAGEIVSTADSFYTYSEMITDLCELQDAYPGLIQIRTAAVTADGRDLAEVLLGNPEAPVHILVQASIHGREYMNSQIAMKQVETLLQQYGTGSYQGKSYQELFGSVCIHLMPMTNPDGVTISQYGTGGIRSGELLQILAQCRAFDVSQNSALASSSDYWMRWKANGRGVDLNRNFDAGWEEYAGRMAPASEMYKGTAPASETETRAILEVAEENSVKAVISYHSAGNIIYWDYGSQGEIYEKDKALCGFLSSITGYPAQSTVQSSTDAAGCSDYFVLKKSIPAVTLENGTGDSPLSIDQFSAVWAANQELLPALAWYFSAETSGTPAWNGAGSQAVRWSPQDTAYGSAPLQSVDGITYQADVYDYLTLRSGPSTSAEEISRLSPFCEMKIVEYTDSTMVKVVTVQDQQTGYVNREYLTPEGAQMQRAGGEAAVGEAAVGSGALVPGVRCHLTCNEFLTLRDAPSTAGNELRKVYVGETVVVVELPNSEFCKVTAEKDGMTGYVMSSYLLPE